MSRSGRVLSKKFKAKVVLEDLRGRNIILKYVNHIINYNIINFSKTKLERRKWRALNLCIICSTVLAIVVFINFVIIGEVLYSFSFFIFLMAHILLFFNKKSSIHQKSFFYLNLLLISSFLISILVPQITKISSVAFPKNRTA